MSEEFVEAETVRRLNRQWMQAYTERDIVALERFISDDYVGTFPDGTVHNKSSEIEGVRSGAIDIVTMEPKEMTVRMYGGTAVLSGRSHIVARIDGKERENDFRFTDIWVRFGDEWRAVGSQVTRIE